jgi:omega-amidase
MTTLSISLGQMNIELGHVKNNFRNAGRLIAEASRRKSNVIVLPELWSTGYDLENAGTHADELNKGMFTNLSKVATQYNIAVVGSILEQRGDNFYNSATFFSPKGRMMGVYRKVHLFRLFEEEKYLEEGNAPLVMDLPWGPTGLAICYDLRFPEIFRTYAVDDQAKLIFISAEWPLERLEHWRSLLIARAIENQCYIVATNSCGKTGDTTFAGHSMIVDPWGKIMVEAGETEQLLTVEIEIDEVDEIRKRIPVFEDRRLDVY